MKPTLQLRISQQLTLTPQLQQAMRLLEENPMLEVAEESAAGTFSPDASSLASRSTATADEPEQAHSDDRGADDFGPDTFGNEPADWNTGGGTMRSTDDEDETYPEQAAEQASLRTHLHSQLTTSSLDNNDRKVVGL